MTVREEVHQEIEDAKQRHHGKDSWRITVFNNWMYYLPGGFLRRLKKHEGRLDELLKGDHHSELYRSHTAREFYTSIDETIAAEGISFKRIKELQEQRFQARTSQEQSRLLYDLFDLTVPVFIRLREMGYNSADISG